MRNEEDYPYMEVPQDWIVIVTKLIDTIDCILSQYNLPLDTIEYHQIKSKHNQLRVYYGIPMLFELEYEDDNYALYSAIGSIIDRVINNCEKYVDYLVKNNLITKEN